MPYIAPEQLESGDVGPLADIYSRGLEPIECLTGRRVFDGPAAEAAARLSRDPDVPAGLAGPWPTLLRTTTAREPEARPTAAAVRGGGTPAADGAAATAPAPAVRTEVTPAGVRPVQRARRTRPRRPCITVLLLATLVAGASVGAVVAYGTTSDEDSSPRPVETPTTLAAGASGGGVVAAGTSGGGVVAAGASVSAVVAYGATSDEDSSPRPAETPTTLAPTTTLPPPTTLSPRGSPATPGSRGTPGTPGPPGTSETRGEAGPSGPAGASPPAPDAPLAWPSAAPPAPPPPTSPPPPPPPGPATCLGLPLPLGIPCPISP